MKYQWRVDGGPRPAVSAKIFGSFVEKLADGDDFGAVSAKAIVEAARPRSSPIHRAFPASAWNDSRAAELYRIDCARKLLGRLQIVRVEMRDQPAQSDRAFYRVQVAPNRSGYVARERILSNRDYQEQLIRRAREELESYVRKFGKTLELSRALPHLRAALDAMRDEADQLATDALRRRERPPGDGPGAEQTMRQ